MNHGDTKGGCGVCTQGHSLYGSGLPACCPGLVCTLERFNEVCEPAGPAGMPLVPRADRIGLHWRSVSDLQHEMRLVPLELAAKDRRQLKAMMTGGAQMTSRRWRRIRTLLLLADGLSARATAEAVGTHPREARRVGHRYRAGGLEAALGADPRPPPSKLLDSTQQAAVIAMVCGPPPAGRARWTVRLVAEQAVRRGIAERMGRETARVTLATSGLKPWREKNVVRPRSHRRVRGADGGRSSPVRPR